ncbi:hypothetical protein PRABACTJOHN_01942 [Parabacteroides johnsonii DSM 18315]|uniref:Uncharacterized protein n=1 Tax=Parabacteroides johnsonii DSM 18315 TaxID=537006 RepID=B7BA86_9BACT|nr:hypothetical protein PRABACTJOHN_01942 [Parabacteroides johnsonii DSM 18315]
MFPFIIDIAKIHKYGCIVNGNIAYRIINIPLLPALNEKYPYFCLS